MTNPSIMQCDRSLDFHPRRNWPRAFPALAWKGLLLTGFDRADGAVLDLWESGRSSFLESVKACYPELGLAELSRLFDRLRSSQTDMARELAEGLFSEYGLRWCERLDLTLTALRVAPMVFQEWVDEKKVSARDLSPLLALKDPADLNAFLTELPALGLSKSQAVQALEWVVDLFLMGRPLNDLLPSDGDGAGYLRRLQQWRKPATSEIDAQWSAAVEKWPWPAQVQGQWQRFGDQSGLEIRLRATSPQDLQKKLERLHSIQDTWSCKS